MRTRGRFTGVGGAFDRLAARDRTGAVHGLSAEGELTAIPGARARSIHDGSQHAVILETSDGTPALLGHDVLLVPELRGTRDVRQVAPRRLCGILEGAVRCGGQNPDNEAEPELPGAVRRFFADFFHRTAVLADGAVLYWGVVDVVLDVPPPEPSAPVAHRPPVLETPSSTSVLSGVEGLWWMSPAVRLDADGALRIRQSYTSEWHALPGAGGAPRRVSASAGEACALTAADGSVRCWGERARADGQARAGSAWVTVPVRGEPAGAPPR